MKIAHVITGTNVGGAERMLHKLSVRLAERGHRQRIVSIIPNGAVGRAMIADGLDVTSLNAAKIPALPLRLGRLALMLRRFRPDLVQSWMYHADLLATLARPVLPGRPVHVWNVRGSTRNFSEYGRTTRQVVRACARLSGVPEAVAVNSRVGLEAHAGFGYAPRRWELLPNGFDTERFRPDPDAAARVRDTFSLPLSARIVIVLARAHPMKDHPNFLRALGRLAPVHPDLHALLIGPEVTPDHPELPALAAREEVADRCVFAGPRSDVHRVLPGVDFLCMPSASGEGFPNVVGEAMASGLPCAVTDVGDAGAIVDDTGVVVPPGDPEALAGGLDLLLREDLEANRRRRERCRQRVIDNYSIERVTDRYEELYEELVAERGRA